MLTNRSLQDPLLSMLVLVVASSACVDDARHPRPASFPFSPDAAVAEFSDMFEVVDSLVLEENDSTLVGLPIVSFDGTHFVTADMHSHQVRVYTKRGELVSSTGSRGEGPGQFRSPVSARRTREGGILVTDPGAWRSTHYRSDALRNPEVTPLPASIVTFDQIDLGDERTLLLGPNLTTSLDSVRRTLHIWNANSAEVDVSFFSNPFPQHLAEAAAFYATVEAEIAEDTIWAAAALSDSVYAFDLDGAQIKAIPLPLSEQAGSMELLWVISAMYLLHDGDIAIRLSWTTAPQTQEVTHYLAIVDRHGEPTALLRDTPKLYVVADDLFYFQNPNHLEPTQWIAARRRNS